MKLWIVFFSISIFSLHASEVVNYSGRLVQSSGAPVTGTPNIRVNILHTTNVECSILTNSVPLTNGVFNLALDFNGQCGGGNLSTLIRNVSGQDLFIQVVDETAGVTYPNQPLNAVPFALTSLTATAAPGTISFAGLNEDGSCDHTQNQYLFYNAAGQFICRTLSPGGVTSLADGAGYTVTTATGAAQFSVNVDGTTIQINGSDNLELVAGGVSNSHLATGIDGSKITTGTIPVAQIDTGIAAGQIPVLDGSGDLPTSVETDPNVQAFAKTSLPTCPGGQILTSNGTTLSCVADADSDTTYSAGTGIDITGTTISVDGLTVCPTGQSLTFLSPSGFTCVDELGEHTATQNFDLATFKLVGNGGTEGISIDATGRVGIGTTSPLGTLHTLGTSAIWMDRVGSGSHLLLRRANGTVGAETATLNGESLGRLSFSGHDGTGFATGSYAGITSYATENWTSTTRGSNLIFKTTQTGQANESDRMIIDSSGNVGIGTNTPSDNLHVANSAGESSVNIDGNGSAALKFNHNGADRAKIRYANSSGNLTIDSTYQGIIFKSGTSGTSTETMRVTANHRVGIGTTAPTEKLDVIGNIKASGDICAGSNCLNAIAAGGGADDLGDHTATQDLVMGANNITFTTGLVDGVDVSALNTTVGTNTSNITSNDTDIAANASAISTNATNISNKEGAITAGTTAQYWRGDKSWQTLDSSVVPENTNLYFTDARARTAAVLNSTAGTETDQSASVSAMKSYVTGLTGAITSSQWTTSGSNVYYNAGNVGIGTTTPGAQLHIATDGRIRLEQSSALWDINVGSGGEYYIEDADLGTKRFAIDGTGNVGIGTIAPGSKLEVNGDLAVGQTSKNSLGIAGNAIYAPALVLGGQATGVDNFYMRREAAGGSYTMQTTNPVNDGSINLQPWGGNVGVGTATPIANFEVAGTSRLDGVYHKAYNWRPMVNGTDNFIFKTANMTNGGESWAQIQVSDGQDLALVTYGIVVKNNGGTNTVAVKVLSGSTTDIGIKLRYSNLDSAPGTTAFFLTATEGKSHGQHVAINGKWIDFNSTTDYTTLADVQLGSQVVIANNGNVGIGNEAPAQKLDVTGSVRATSFIGDGSGLTGVAVDPAASISLSGDAAKDLSVGRHPTADTAGSNLGVTAGGATVGATNKNGGSLELSSGTSTGTGSSSINFKTASSGTTGTTDNAPTTKMTLTGDGDLGLGTTTPSSKLTIMENHNTDTFVSVINNDTGTAARSGVVVSNSGTAYGSDSGGMVLYGTGYSSTPDELHIFSNSGVANGMKLTTSSGPIELRGAGNVGIGTSGSAGAKFTVQQSGVANTLEGIRVQADKDANGTNDEYLDIYIDSAGVKNIQTQSAGGAVHELVLNPSIGNVGIGKTPASSFNLDVAGDASFNNGRTVLRDNSLEEHATNGNSQIALNYVGYNQGTTQFRDVNVFDGKNSSFAFFDGSARSFGLGTITPAERFHLNGNDNRAITMQPGTTTQNINFIHNDNGNVNARYANITGILSNGGSGYNFGHLSFSTGPATAGNPATIERMRITGGGDVGIGTTTPVETLDVNGNINVANAISIAAGDSALVLNGGGGSSNSYHAKISMFGGSHASTPGVTEITMGENAGSYLSFGKEAGGALVTDLMRITDTGNVGIGTTTPSGDLEVDGTDGTVVISGTEGEGYYSNIQANNHANFLIGSNLRISETGTGHDLEVSSTHATIAGSGITFGGNSASDDFIAPGAVAVYARGPASVTEDDAYNEAPTAVFKAGNVGIGTIDPLARLHVAGSVRPDEGLLFYSTPVKTIDDYYTALMNGANTDAFFIAQVDGTSFGATNNEKVFAIADGQTNKDDGISFITMDSTGFSHVNMRIRGNGNIGIGTAAPTETLHVEGSIKVTSCPSDMVKYGGWCMEKTDNATNTYRLASTNCSSKGMQMCPNEVHYLCDADNGADCTWTDVATEVRWGAGHCSTTAGGSWHGNFCALKGDNTFVLATASDSYQYRCCKPLP